MSEKLYIFDTTLRDGEQTSGVSFAPQEKLSIARLLLTELHVDRIEIASARVSEGEFLSVNQVCSWASKQNFIDKIEILGFIDKGISIRWVPRGEPAGEGVAQTLPRTVAPHPAGAPLRHPRHDRRGRRTGHEGERLPRRLVERHDTFSRICIYAHGRSAR